MSSPDHNTGPIIDLLDKAYDSPARPERYGEFMEAARALLFAADGATPSPPRILELDEKLAPHVERIKALFRDAPAAPAVAVNARFTVAAGRAIDGNAAAEAFFGARFPCSIDALGLTRETARKLSAACAGADGGGLVLLMSERNGGAAAGLVTRDGATTEISLSHIEWTAPTVRFIASALDLTDSETDVLAGHLRGLTQCDIARERGRSAETVKAQTKSILRKSGCAKMGDLARLSANIALLRIAHAPAPPRPYAFDPETNAPLSLAAANGRTLSYYVYGAADGFPVLFVHGSLVGPFVTQSFADGLRALGVTLYAPSRPGFGETSAAPRGQYDALTVADALALGDHIGAREIIVATIHGGVSHAYRCAAAFGERVKGMVMVGAGVPINDRKHLAHMNSYTRIAAAAAKYAPAVFEMIVSVGIAAYSRRGARRFIDDYFADSAIDRDTLRDGEVYTLVEKGIAHLTDQGARTFVDDGASQMADWTGDFDSVHARALWLHACDDPVMRVDFLEEFVTARSNHPVERTAQGGYLLLYRRPEIALGAIARALKW